MNGFYKAQNDILSEVQANARDPNAARWTAVEVYRSLNRALDTWHQRVSVPQVYTIPNGWSATDYDYALPAYIRPPVQPQIQFTDVNDPDSATTWVNMRGWTTEPDGSGGLTLRVRVSPQRPNVNATGRILWWGRNSTVPTTVPVLRADGMTAATTTLTVTTAVDVQDTGFIKIDAEWIGYSGIERATDGTTLNNLTRGLNGTNATTHAAGASVYWGVYSPASYLFQALNDCILMHLHELYITDASPKETELHERLMLYYEGRVRDVWRRFVPARSPVMVEPHNVL